MRIFSIDSENLSSAAADQDALRETRGACSSTQELPRFSYMCFKLTTGFLKEQKDNSEGVKVLQDVIQQLSSLPSDLSIAIKPPSTATTETKKHSLTLNSLLN